MKPSPELIERYKQMVLEHPIEVLTLPQANPGPRRSWLPPEEPDVVFIDHVGLLATEAAT